ncbi:MAG: hypothetical protein HY390_02220 [Deltaproteobacteria bacterium]|nr:hypothetical protein [Deltaproteobacteria bacterium]
MKKITYGVLLSMGCIGILFASESLLNFSTYETLLNSFLTWTNRGIDLSNELSECSKLGKKEKESCCSKQTAALQKHFLSIKKEVSAELDNLHKQVDANQEMLLRRLEKTVTFYSDFPSSSYDWRFDFYYDADEGKHYVDFYKVSEVGGAHKIWTLDPSFTFTKSKTTSYWQYKLVVDETKNFTIEFMVFPEENRVGIIFWIDGERYRFDFELAQLSQ